MMVSWTSTKVSIEVSICNNSKTFVRNPGGLIQITSSRVHLSNCVCIFPQVAEKGPSVYILKSGLDIWVNTTRLTTTCSGCQDLLGFCRKKETVCGFSKPLETDRDFTVMAMITQCNCNIALDYDYLIVFVWMFTLHFIRFITTTYVLLLKIDNKRCFWVSPETSSQQAPSDVYLGENQWDFNGHDVCLMEGIPEKTSCL